MGKPPKPDTVKKPKLNILPHDVKRDIVKKLKQGTSGRCLASQYNVSTSTISRIKRDSDKLMELSKGCRAKKMDSFLSEWIQLYRSKGIPLSGPAICVKAMAINEKYSILENFKV